MIVPVPDGRGSRANKPKIASENARKCKQPCHLVLEREGRYLRTDGTWVDDYGIAKIFTPMSGLAAAKVFRGSRVRSVINGKLND